MNGAKQVDAGTGASDQRLPSASVALRNERSQEVLNYLMNQGGIIRITMYGKSLLLDKESVRVRGSEEEHAFNLITNVAGGLNQENFDKFFTQLKRTNVEGDGWADERGNGSITVGNMTVEFKKWGQTYRGATGVTEVSEVDSGEQVKTNIQNVMTATGYRNKWKKFFNEMGMNVSEADLNAKITEYTNALLGDSSKFNLQEHVNKLYANQETAIQIHEAFFNTATAGIRSSEIEQAGGVKITSQWQNESTTGEGFRHKRASMKFMVEGDDKTHTLMIGKLEIGESRNTTYTVMIDGRRVGNIDREALKVWGVTEDGLGNLAVGNMDRPFSPPVPETVSPLEVPDTFSRLINGPLVAKSYGAFGLVMPEDAALPADPRRMLQGILDTYFRNISEPE